MTSTGIKFDVGKAEGLYFYLVPLSKIVGDPKLLSIAQQVELLIEKYNKIPIIDAKTLKALHKKTKDYILTKVKLNEMIEGVCLVSKLGATKYGLYNYRNSLEGKRLLNALCRHLIKYMLGQKKDTESKKDHMYHVLANIYMLTTSKKEV